METAGDNSEEIKNYFRANGISTNAIDQFRNGSPSLISATTKSPRLHLACMTPERREHVLRVIRRAIPIYAAAKRRIIEENAQYATLCIQDAFAGRLNNGLATNSKKSWMIYTLFRIQTSEWLFNSVIIASTLHTFLVFFEPPHACSSSWLYYLLQWLILFIYLVDIALKMSYEGPKVTFHYKRRIMKYLCLCVYFTTFLRNISSMTGKGCMS